MPVTLVTTAPLMVNAELLMVLQSIGAEEYTTSGCPMLQASTVSVGGGDALLTKVALPLKVML